MSLGCGISANSEVTLTGRKNVIENNDYENDLRVVVDKYLNVRDVLVKKINVVVDGGGSSTVLIPLCQTHHKEP